VSKTTIGWDIGGAHLKVVQLDEKGKLVQALQLPCPLWRGLNELEAAVNAALKAFKIASFGAGSLNIQHAVTMTGELVDLFANRHEGVMAISTLAAVLLGKDTLYYAVNEGLVALERVSENTHHIASANWHASASALAMHVQDALIIDVGSTTTDIIAIESSKVKNTSFSDAARMANDSLVYTGVVRTPVMALGTKLVFEGSEINVAAEYFATMADVYRLTGELLPVFDMAETADNKSKSTVASARRLARMVGYDVEDRPIGTWKSLANTCRNMQVGQIKAAALKHLKPSLPIIGAGSGAFLVKQIAHDLGHGYQSASIRFTESVNKKYDVEVCLPAYAVAYLARPYV
jgi:(4-(4-[2-(gamma-L-glutamylamino)ethyl]phenoxymethyl)furan-2-yl)methanamine synthase